MKPLQTQLEAEVPNQEFADTIKEKPGLVPKNTITGSQYQEPLFKYHGACGGCGETAYYKLLTQSFGDRLMIGNATGCSSIYGGSVPSFPFCTNQEGIGPAWCTQSFRGQRGIHTRHEARAGSA